MGMQFFASLVCDAPGCMTGMGERKPIKGLTAARETIWNEAQLQGWTSSGKLRYCPNCREYPRKAAKGSVIDPLTVLALRQMAGTE